MSQNSPANAVLDRIQMRAFVVGFVGLAVAGALWSNESFFPSYLLAWLFWTGLGTGCMALLMVHYLSGGSWGFVIRRVLEAGTRTLSLMALLALPLWYAIPKLYLWAQPEKVHGDKILEGKAAYLNVDFFMWRTAFYFLVWLLLAHLLNKWSADQDKTGDPAIAGRLEGLSGPGLVFLGLTVTFHAMDWGMSLEPHWFSTMYGLQFIIGQVLGAMAFSIIITRALFSEEPHSKVLTSSHFHDLGNLMLAFTMLWAYLSFSQFLIIWSANLPEEIPWYQHRIGLGWQRIALMLVLFHFAMPFILLLSRDIKRKAKRVAMVAAAMLFMRTVDLFWIIKPAFAQEGEGFHVDLLDPSWIVGLGGVWIGFFCWQLKRRPLFPLHDPIGAEMAAGRHGEHLEAA